MFGMFLGQEIQIAFVPNTLAHSNFHRDKIDKANFLHTRRNLFFRC